MVHLHNPSNSGDRNLEDHSWNTDQADSSQDPVLKIHITNRAGRMTELLLSKCEAPSSSSSTKKKKKTKEISST
jgi:hypothetical protein